MAKMVVIPWLLGWSVGGFGWFGLVRVGLGGS